MKKDELKPCTNYLCVSDACGNEENEEYFENYDQAVAYCMDCSQRDGRGYYVYLNDCLLLGSSHYDVEAWKWVFEETTISTADAYRFVCPDLFEVG